MNIPTLLYHHVNCIDKDHTLNVRPNVFERQMEYLAHNNYRTILLDEIAHLEEKEEYSDKTVAITFDDGYLDNWVYAYPILKKYGLKATIFVTTGNIKDSDEIRPNIEDMWGKKFKKEDLPKIDIHFNVNFDCTPGQPNRRYGFMSWGELRSMQGSGLIDIQSHSHTHGYYYVSGRITGFNRMKSWAVSWPTDGDARFGIPLYERKPSLVARRYFDDPGLRDRLVDSANTLTGSFMRIFSPYIWQKKLHKRAEGLLSDNKSSAYYESQDAYAKRVKKELSSSKEHIEDKLNKSCDYLSFPAGKYNATVIECLKETGYKAAFINTDPHNVDNGLKYTLPRKIALGSYEWFVDYLKRNGHAQ